jgi:hypothetical protein
VLNSDNNTAANLQKKRKRVDAPIEAPKDVKRPVETKDADAIMVAAPVKPPVRNQEDEDSYEFDPVCHNCSG